MRPRVYRRCRAAGTTPRGMVDCMIAAVASRYGASLLAQDVDLVRVCHIVGITLDQTAELIGAELRAVVTYDQRMVLVAASLGLFVDSPS
jgi:uncharacterized protein YacL